MGGDGRRGIRVPPHQRADPAGDKQKREGDAGGKEGLDLSTAEGTPDPPQQRQVSTSVGGLLLSRRIEVVAACRYEDTISECY